MLAFGISFGLVFLHLSGRGVAWAGVVLAGMQDMHIHTHTYIYIYVIYIYISCKCGWSIHFQCRQQAEVQTMFKKIVGTGPVVEPAITVLPLPKECNRDSKSGLQQHPYSRQPAANNPISLAQWFNRLTPHPCNLPNISYHFIKLPPPSPHPFRTFTKPPTFMKDRSARKKSRIKFSLGRKPRSATNSSQKPSLDVHHETV